MVGPIFRFIIPNDSPLTKITSDVLQTKGAHFDHYHRHSHHHHGRCRPNMRCRVIMSGEEANGAYVKASDQPPDQDISIH